MVHVKDRAEELVKLDLADFRPSEEPTDNGAPEQFIRRAQHEPVLYVRYPSNTQDVSIGGMSYIQKLMLSAPGILNTQSHSQSCFGL